MNKTEREQKKKRQEVGRWERQVEQFRFIRERKKGWRAKDPTSRVSTRLIITKGSPSGGGKGKLKRSRQ